MRSVPKTLFLIFAVFIVAAPVFAQEAGYRVVEVSGTCDIIVPPETEWKALAKGEKPAVGSVIRTTGPDSSVELVADPHFENALRIGPDSRVAFLNILPLRISLDSGSLFILKEEQRYLGRAAEETPEVRILTRQFLVSVRQGGCELDDSGKDVVLKTFAESVSIQAKGPAGYADAATAVEEGFRYSGGGLARLTYPDYAIWQAWYKRNNERKDEIVRPSN